jgi:hypothetical protein
MTAEAELHAQAVGQVLKWSSRLYGWSMELATVR